MPGPIRRTFAFAGAASFLAWGVVSLFLSLVPSYVIETLHTSNLEVIGGLARAMLACSAVVQVAGRRVPPLLAQAIGLALVTAAAAALVEVAYDRSLAVMVASGAMAGLGLGLAFRGALSQVSTVAPEDRKGDILASYYLVVYLGIAVPVVGVGVLALSMGLRSAVSAFGYLVGAACLVMLGLLVAELRR